MLRHLDEEGRINTSMLRGDVRTARFVCVSAMTYFGMPGSENPAA